MAGSYRHVCKEDGSFIEEEFTQLIENLGDAWEACEMMHHMIGYLAQGNVIKIKKAEQAYHHSINPGDHAYPGPP